MNSDFIELTKKHFLKTYQQADPNIIPYKYLPEHVVECEKWAKRILKKYPKANEEVLLVAVWLYDIGQVFEPKDKDHAIKSEREAKRFLSEVGFPLDLIKEVAHCVRSHRNRDVRPRMLEAKILAAADSASHMTDACYIDMAQKAGKEAALAKIERDYRDVGFLKELKKEVTPIYRAWKNLIRVLPN